MSQALTRYEVLGQSFRSRKRRPPEHKGLDRVAATLGMRLRTRRVSIKWLRSQAEAVDQHRVAMRAMGEVELAREIAEMRERFIRAEPDQATLIRGTAIVREAARRETGQEAYIVQVMGAMALFHGRIIEMLTGEGKTLTGAIAGPLLAWRHKKVHVFTVNDYLAKRDAESRECIYKRCLLTCGAIQQEMEPLARFDIYSRSIVYGTPKQITADWLRDQIRLAGIHSPWAGRRQFGMDEELDARALGRDLAAASGMWSGGAMIPGLKAALVDEADAVLIDEGVVPLIIAQSRKIDEMAEVYKHADTLAGILDQGKDFLVDSLRRRVELTPRGRERCTALLENRKEAIWRASRRAQELIRTSLVARWCYKRGQQYEIVDGRIMIVDEFTGRFLVDRTWEQGLHQSVEAKENVEISADRETLARLSFQRFFRSYPFLCGMTGTAADATREMEKTYQRPVTVVPTNRPIARVQMPTRVFRTPTAKWDAIVKSIEQIHEANRPMLIGTRSIQASELLSKRLSERGMEHKVLNANFDKDEASIIERAGEAGSIVVATNMAGRGTDIMLDLAAKRAGGLHVILTEMHAAKRVDRQFIGRAGRQGDPGSAQIFASLRDELLSLHAPGLTKRLTTFSGGGDELSGLSLTLATKLLRIAQRRAEARDRAMRTAVLAGDTWVDANLFGQ